MALKNYLHANFSQMFFPFPKSERLQCTHTKSEALNNEMGGKLVLSTQWAIPFLGELA